MHRFLVVRWILLAAVVAMAALGRQPAVRAAAEADAVVAWNGIAVRAAVNTVPNGGAGFSPSHSLIVIGYVQAAVYNAVMAIEGGYAPYHSSLAAQPGASVEAAVAAAAHDVLMAYLPTAQHSALAAEYAAALAAIPAGQAKDLGVALGQAAAAEILVLRQGDGYLANVPVNLPNPAGGVWVLPTAPAVPLTPWVGKLRPFFMRSASQFRPGPPAGLATNRWVKDFNEVLAYGRSDSTVRTAAQTDAARFWTEHPGRQMNQLFTDLVALRGLDAAQAARLYAMGNMVTADAAIACWDAKYHYLFWRPQHAIAGAYTDGNERTLEDPTWTPLIGTPPHPEYPSGHGCVTSALAQVLTELMGTHQIDVTIRSTVPGLAQSSRHFATAQQLRAEIINVRVWAGIHYRYSDEVGVKIGQAVSNWALNHNFEARP